jgi:hypothetical protein
LSRSGVSIQSTRSFVRPCRLMAKVVAGGGEHGVDGIAAGMGKVIWAHAVVFLEVADDGLDGGPPFEFALDLRRDAALLAARVDLELVIGRGLWPR